MSARKEDALKGLQLLEQYRARLEGTDELALQGTLSNAIAALRSSRFTALLDIHDAYVTSLELSKGVRFTKQTDQSDRRYTLVSPSSNSSSAWNTSAHLTSVFNGSARVHVDRVGRTEVLVTMSQQVTDADSPIEARDLRDVKVPTTDQTVPEATAGSAMLSMETETSCEPTIQVTDMNMMERHGYVPDPAPTAGVESNASVETILPAHTNGTINQEAKRENVEHAMYMPTPLKGATEDVLDEQRCLAELKHTSMGEQKTTSSDEQQTEQKCNAQNDPQKTLCNGEQNPPCNGEQNPPCNGEQNPPCNGEQNPPCNGEQNPPCNGEQNPPCNGEQNPPCNGEQNPPCNGEQRSEQGSPPVCVVEQEKDKQRHPGVTEEQGPVCNSEHKSAEGQKHACNGEQMPLSAEEQKALKATAKRFNIAKEFMDTEAKYVDRLKIISDFLGIVREFDADNKHIIPELTNRLMFGHVQEMYELNSSLLKGLQHCMDVWKTEERLGVILREYAPKLKVYCLYAAGYEDAIKAITNWSARDKKFDILVKEFDERMGEGSGGGFITRCMLEPVLRILRYRLLLTEYIKYGVKGSSELENSEAAQTVISEAASESNSRIEELKNCNEILAIQRSLNVTKSLLVSGRSFIKKGELLKQSRKTSYTRMFFLFSDILLHTDLCIGLGQSFKIKDELSVWGMKVEEPLVPPLPYCFIVTSVKRSLILSASSQVEKQDWMKALRRAIDAHQKIVSTLKTPPTLTGDFGSCAPIMVPDKNVTMCQLCAELFTTTFRRHHCRACGKVVCGNCSQKKAYLAYNSKFERVCDLCYASSTRRRANSYTSAIAGSEPLEDITEDPNSVHHSIPLDDSDVLLTKGFDTTAAIAGYVWVMEKKRFVKMWYQVKKDFVLYKFKAHEDVKAVGTVPLPGFLVKPDLETATISLLHESIERDFVIHESFKLDNPTDLEKWITVLCKATQLQAVPPPIQQSL